MVKIDRQKCSVMLNIEVLVSRENSLVNICVFCQHLIHNIPSANLIAIVLAAYAAQLILFRIH